MHKPSDSVYLQPSLVLAARQVNIYDAMNLVAYAKVPLITARRAGDLIAGFIQRVNDTVGTAFLSQGQKDRLLEKYASDLARLRHPVAAADYAMLQEKMLDAGKPPSPTSSMSITSSCIGAGEPLQWPRSIGGSPSCSFQVS